MEVLSLSGNFCSDKKATGLNWIEGRGKSVVCEAIVSGHIVNKVNIDSVYPRLHERTVISDACHYFL